MSPDAFVGTRVPMVPVEEVINQFLVNWLVEIGSERVTVILTSPDTVDVGTEIELTEGAFVSNDCLYTVSPFETPVAVSSQL